MQHATYIPVRDGKEELNMEALAIENMAGNAARLCIFSVSCSAAHFSRTFL